MTKFSNALAVVFVLSYSLAIAQAPIDTVLLRQYSYTVYNGGLTNYSASQGQNNLLFFGNSSGLLTFDGSNWEHISIGTGEQVLAVLADQSRIYVGGIQEFGFLEQDINNEWQYTSLYDLVPQEISIDEIWQIVKTPQGIYFQSYQGIIYYDGNSLKVIDVKNAYIFNVNNKIICSSFDGNIKIIEGDHITEALETPELYGDAAFSIIQSQQDKQHLYLTAEAGVWLMETNPLQLRKWEHPLSDKLEDVGFYHGKEYRDSLIIASTWREGIIVFKKNGDFLRIIDLKQGLPNGELREIYIDDNENIWILANAGIYQMRFTLNPLIPEFKPITYVTSVESASGNSYNLNRNVEIYDPKSIVVSYTTPGLNKEDLEYSFYLEGYDDSWTQWSQQYTKEYAGLMNKKYTFKVKARAIGTSIESEPGTIGIKIRLPWFKRKIIIAFLVSSLIAIGILIVRFRTVQMNKAKEDLERKVNQRTHELSLEREKLQTLNSELKLANDELDNFVYRSSHDLIAPLKSLLGLTNIIRLETTDQKVLPYVNLMEKSTHKLEKFITSIMEYSMNAKSDISVEKVVFEEMIREILDEIKYFDITQEVSLTFSIGVNEIYSDPRRLKIILNNLITNSVKYHNPEAAQPWVKIVTEDLGREVKIMVQDNGIGIGQEHLAKVYDMFYRATENAEGSGLGMYIVKDTVQKLEGRIELHSILGEGTEVVIYLPKR